jgi:hypothetical protein
MNQRKLRGRYCVTPRGERHNDRLSILWREVISLAEVRPPDHVVVIISRPGIAAYR